MTARRAVPLLVCLAGLAMTLHTVFLSGFARIHADEGDARHQNYVLEHVYRAVSGDPLHADIWSPPDFFPVRNTGPYSEMLLGAAPIYVPLRALGLPPDTSLQLFTALVLLLDFAAAYALYRSSCGFRFAGASAGAFLFAFGAYRACHVGHHLLLPQFFTPLALVALERASRADRLSRGPAANAWTVLFCLGVAAQIYAGLHLGWFLVFGLAVAVSISVALPSSRPHVLGFLRRRWGALFAGGVLAAAAVFPLLSHQLAAMRETGVRSYALVADFLPPLKAWINPGPFSWLYGPWLGRWTVVASLPMYWEKALFPGLATGLLVLLGVRSSRHRSVARIGVLVAGALVLLATSWPGGHSLWRVVYELVPGAQGMRAVGRVGLLLLVPMGAAVAAAVDDLLSRRLARPVVAAILVFAALEQAQALPSYDKFRVRERVSRIARAIPRDCPTFFYSPILPPAPYWETQLDGMWAALEVGKPTVNGYSSNLPAGWDPLMAHALSFRDEPRVRENLDAWIARERLSPASVCWVQLPAWEPVTRPLPPGRRLGDTGR